MTLNQRQSRQMLIYMETQEKMTAHLRHRDSSKCLGFNSLQSKFLFEYNIPGFVTAIKHHWLKFQIPQFDRRASDVITPAPARKEASPLPALIPVAIWPRSVYHNESMGVPSVIALNIRSSDDFTDRFKKNSDPSLKYFSQSLIQPSMNNWVISRTPRVSSRAFARSAPDKLLPSRG
jgi:hypothetical protein